MTKQSRIILVEGIDKAGKSTVVAELLRRNHKWVTVKGLSAKDPEQFRRHAFKLLEDVQKVLDSGAEKVIVDRMHLTSDPIYNPTLRDASRVDEIESYVQTYADLGEVVKRINDTYGIAAFIFTAAKEVILDRMEKMGGPEDHLEEKVKANVEHYLQGYDALYVSLVTESHEVVQGLFDTVVAVDSTSLTPSKIADSIEAIVKQEDLPQEVSTIGTSEEKLLRSKPLQVAAIVPKEYPDLGDFSLALAQNLLDNQAQVDLWRYHRGYKVLDNGAFELGESLPFTEVLRLAGDIRADEVVLPDVFRDPQATISRAKYALKMLAQFQKSRQVPKDLKTMAVVQGNTLVEWIACYNTLRQLPGVDVIAINRDSAKLLGSRIALLEHLEKYGLIDTTKEYHLLGMADNILEIREVHVKYPWVRSMDSCFPFLIAKGVASGMIDEHTWYKEGIDRSLFKETIDFEDTFQAATDHHLGAVKMAMRAWGVKI